MSSCCAHGSIKMGGFDELWVCCELEKDHIGRHQMRMKQKAKEGKGWLVVLWDINEKFPNTLGLCPNCAE